MKHRRLVLGAVASVAITGPALATDFTWSGSFSTLFQAPPNWSPFQFKPPISGPPDSTELATFDLGNATYAVTFSASHTSLRTRIGDDAVTFNLGGFTFNNASTTDPAIALGYGIGAGDLASLTLTNGTLSGQDARIAAVGGMSSASMVVGSGATLNLSGLLSVGRLDTGSLTVMSGGDVVCASATLGEMTTTVPVPSTGNGTATVTGAGSTWVIADQLTIGNAGPGSLSIQGGGKVLPSCTVCLDYFNMTAPATGTTANIAIAGAGSELDVTGGMSLGATGQGTLTVSAGGTLKTNSSLFPSPTNRDQIGVSNGSVGNVTVTGPGSSWIAGNSISIGGSWIFSTTPSTGAGHLVFSDGAAVQLGGLTLGLAPTSTGTAQVTGGASLDAGITLSVGSFGSGSLTINTGGDVTASNLRISSGAGSSGSVVVDGAGSTLAGVVDFTIGGSGSGSMTISNGAAVTHQATNLPHILVENGSTIMLNGGTLTTPTVLVRGALIGQGTVNANVINEGVVVPGNSPGILSIVGNYTQLPSRALNIEIGGAAPGTQHDRLNVTGNVAVGGGTLSLALINGFVPAPNQQFVIINTSGGAVTGTFATVNPPNTWQVIYSAQNVVVQPINDCPADISPSGGNNAVNVDDLLAVISGWGSCAAPCPPRCAADIAPIRAGDCAVNVDDLVAVINAWGACP